MALSAYFNEIRRNVDGALHRLVMSQEAYPRRLHESMRYSLFAGGKRLRPMLAVAANDAVKGSRECVIAFACALEIIHTYTLIHDDLPAMDNDDMRRGVPTNHKKFDEPTAILAGDALLTLAFEIMSDRSQFPGVSAEKLLTVNHETAIAIGSLGTVGGQMVDIMMEAAEPDPAVVEYIHTHKTGKLIVASVRGGALLGGAAPDQLEVLTEYARNAGLAFQIIDDILDVEGEAAKLGKNPGVDAEKGKMTYPAVMGIEESRKLAARLIDRAIASLEMFGEDGGHLKDLAEYIIARAF